MKTMRTRSFSGNGFVSPIPPGESKSLITFPPTQVAPLGLWVIPPTKEHAASHQRRCLSIGLHHPHPAPSSPSGSIISIIPIGLHHPHLVPSHLAPSSPSGSIISAPSTSIRFHHFHPAPSSPSPPSGSIILHWVTSSPSGSITSIQLHHPHRAPSNCIISTGLHHLHRAPSGPTVTVTQGGERNLAMREQCHPKWTEDTVSSGGVGEFLAAAELC